MATARAQGERQHSEDRGTIGVTVTLFADLRRFLPPGIDGPHRRIVPAGSTVADLLDAIGIPADADVTVGLGGELANRTDLLHDGADVMLLSPMEGGSPLAEWEEEQVQRPSAWTPSRSGPRDLDLTEGAARAH